MPDFLQLSRSKWSCQMRINRAFKLIWLLGLIVLIPETASTQELAFPEQPPSEHWYVDEAELIQQEDRAKIDEIAFALWNEEQIPLYVVTIRSLTGYNLSGAPITIEYYANELFNYWGIGSQERNYGMLLLVSVGDRKARIQLGADWDFSYNIQARNVMNSLIIPPFKKGEYSLGIFQGVQGMDALARGLALPKPKLAWWILPAIFLGLVLVIGVIISLFKSGRKGWGWALIIALGILFIILWKILSALSAGGSSAGFGGGSSAGGGATGSW